MTTGTGNSVLYTHAALLELPYVFGYVPSLKPCWPRSARSAVRCVVGPATFARRALYLGCVAAARQKPLDSWRTLA